MNVLINLAQILLVIMIIVCPCVGGWFWGLTSIKKEREIRNNTPNNKKEKNL